MNSVMWFLGSKNAQQNLLDVLSVKYWSIVCYLEGAKAYSAPMVGTELARFLQGFLEVETQRPKWIQNL